MKKWISLSMVCCMLVGLLCACGDSAPEVTEPVPGTKLHFAYNTENFMQDHDYTEILEDRDSTLRMQSIRGETESAQLIVTPDKAVEAYSFEIKELVTENGDKISKSKIDIFYQWYVTVESTYNADAYYGNYPDALVPAKAMKRARLNSIEAGNNQGIWVQVNIPEDAEPGLYTGTGKLELDDEEFEIPVELTVYDVQMPEEVHAVTSFEIWYDKISVGEGTYSPQLADTYFWYLVDKRVMPMEPSTQIMSDMDTYVDWVAENLADNPKISAYALPRYWEETDGGKIISRDGITNLLTKMAQKNVELRKEGNETIDLFKKAIFHTHHEPVGNGLELVKKTDLVITQCKQAVAEQYLKDYPDLYDSCLAVGNRVTVGFSEDLIGSDTAGGVQTWCPHLDSWHSPEQRQQFYARQNTADRVAGEQVWWYGSNIPRAPFATYHLDDALISSRLLSWMQYDYRCDGNFYWSTTQYTSGMWETPYSYNQANGDGVLLYPGDKFGMTEPIATMRLESIREGYEDYEYLWMLEQAILKYNAEQGTAHDPQALMAPLYEGLYDGMKPNRENNQGFAQRRTEVLKILELSQKDPAAAISQLESM